MPAITRLLPLVVALSPVWADPAFASAWKEFKDARVSCSDGLTCEVAFEARGDAPALGSFLFERKAGAGTPVDLVISAEGLDAGSALAISIDGKPVLTVPVASLVYDGDFYRYRLPGSAETLSLLDAARNGAAAELAASKGSKPVSSSYSLAGLVAGLIFVDELQGRLETPDALQVKGTKDTPPIIARDIREIAEIPESVRPEFQGDGACSFFDEARFRNTGGFETEVGDGYSLMGLPCAEGGAYNQPYVFFAGFNGDYDRLYLPAMGEKGPTVTSMAWNVGWDNKNRLLDAFFKGRGIGDCGSYDKWELMTAGEGPAFMLVEARAKDECDGNDGGGIENWPLVWPVGKK